MSNTHMNCDIVGAPFILLTNCVCTPTLWKTHTHTHPPRN